MGVAGGLPKSFEKVLQKCTSAASARSARAWGLTHKKTHFKKLLDKIENVLKSCQEMKSVL